jgi:oligo-1,6-glucosidase
MTQKKWWMESVGYQIYPRSFFDTNHDGIGDLKGIYQKLEYLKKLGISLIWIGPFYDSPMDDNGYDVRDFYQVSHLFGTMEDFKDIIKKAHDLDIRVMMDLVLNHTSDEHPWFLESKKSLDNPYRDYYIWKAPKVIDNQIYPPNNWGSFFGGSAWQYDEVTQSYYMKIFSNKMPDLNWENPKVREEMMNVARFYLDLGVDGFRIDAVSHLDRGDFKDADGTPDQIILDWKKFSNLPKVHTYLKTFRKEVFDPKNALSIGEVGGEATIKEALNYASFDSNEVDAVFNFDHNWCNNLWHITDTNDLVTDVICLKNAFRKWQTAFKDQGWLPLNWLNHDQPRLMSHYGSKAYPLASGKMLATALYLMRGTPFIYQGEEIGMTNYPFESIEAFNDIATINHYHETLKTNPTLNPAELLKKIAKTSRDHPRTPFQWSGGLYAGFSTHKPWLDVNPNHTQINLENQMNDPDSLWSHYQKLISLRMKSRYKDLIVYGSYEILDFDDPNLYTYRRQLHQDILIVINSFTQNTIIYDLSKYIIIEVISQNYTHINIQSEHIHLKPYESIAVMVKEKI